MSNFGGRYNIGGSGSPENPLFSGQNNSGLEPRLTGTDLNTGDNPGHRRRSVPSGTGPGNVSRMQSTPNHELPKIPKTPNTPNSPEISRKKTILNKIYTVYPEKEAKDSEEDPNAGTLQKVFRNIDENPDLLRDMPPDPKSLGLAGKSYYVKLQYERWLKRVGFTSFEQTLQEIPAYLLDQYAHIRASERYYELSTHLDTGSSNITPRTVLEIMQFIMDEELLKGEFNDWADRLIDEYMPDAQTKLPIEIDFFEHGVEGSDGYYVGRAGENYLIAVGRADRHSPHMLDLLDSLRSKTQLRDPYRSKLLGVDKEKMFYRYFHERMHTVHAGKSQQFDADHSMRSDQLPLYFLDDSHFSSGKRRREVDQYFKRHPQDRASIVERMVQEGFAIVTSEYILAKAVDELPVLQTLKKWDLRKTITNYQERHYTVEDTNMIYIGGRQLIQDLLTKLEKTPADLPKIIGYIDLEQCRAIDRANLETIRKDPLQLPGISKYIKENG